MRHEKIGILEPFLQFKIFRSISFILALLKKPIRDLWTESATNFFQNRHTYIGDVAFSFIRLSTWLVRVLYSLHWTFLNWYYYAVMAHKGRIIGPQHIHPNVCLVNNLICRRKSLLICVSEMTSFSSMMYFFVI